MKKFTDPRKSGCPVILVLFIILYPSFVYSQTLLLKGPFEKKQWEMSHLVTHPKVIEHKLYVPFYKSNLTLKLIPLKLILKGLKENDKGSFTFTAMDGYSIVLDYNELFEKNGYTPYLAVEGKPGWPLLSKKEASAGPFFLAWIGKNPSVLKTLKWPYMLQAIEWKQSFKDLYPGLIPAPNASKTVHKGLDVFRKKCFSCHKLYQWGEATLGPDLGYPYSPLEYLNKKYFDLYVRNPQSLRKWKNSQMIGFNKTELSDIK